MKHVDIYAIKYFVLKLDKSLFLYHIQNIN